MKSSTTLLVLIGVALVTQQAQAISITSLFGTGLDASGNPLAAGASDSHYTVVETSGQAHVITDTSPYLPNDANSLWIWQNADGTPTNATRTFQTTFDLTGLDPSTAVITGLWGTDNIGVDILINGDSTGISLPIQSRDNFTSLHAFTINSGFVSGTNTLDFVIQDVGVVSAFRAQLDGTADPESVPVGGSTALMLSASLLGFGAIRRKLK